VDGDERSFGGSDSAKSAWRSPKSGKPKNALALLLYYLPIGQLFSKEGTAPSPVIAVATSAAMSATMSLSQVRPHAGISPHTSYITQLPLPLSA
jgi:hypothetical protein